MRPSPRRTPARSPRRRGAGLLALGALLALTAVSCAPTSTPPDVLVLSLDTVRPDRLGVYGWPRPTSPRLDALAEGAVVFEQAMAPTSLTAPSHSTLFTGLQPWRHGTLRNGQPLAATVPVLAEVFAAAGWRTAAFVSGFPMTRDLSGLERGFGHYDDAIEHLRRPGTETVDAALAWLADNATGDQDTPRFLFVHLYDAHGPYEPPAELAALFESDTRGPWVEHHHQLPQYQRQKDPRTGGIVTDLRFYLDRYEAAIRHVDTLVDRLLDAVDLEHTIVLVVSDHGETLLERNAPIDHGSRLFREQLHIVGLLAAPSLEPGRIEPMVGLADFAPTLLELVALDPALLGEPLDGRSLLPLITGTRDAWRPRHRATTAANPMTLKHRGYVVESEELVASIADDGWKLILYPGVDGEIAELYDLRRDPDEANDLAAEHPEQVERLRALLDPAQREAQNSGGAIDPEAAARLRALGYVAGG
ncbi:MAG: sulfatase [Acidobacteriota bacterium]